MLMAGPSNVKPNFYCIGERAYCAKSCEASSIELIFSTNNNNMFESYERLRIYITGTETLYYKLTAQLLLIPLSFPLSL